MASNIIEVENLKSQEFNIKPIIISVAKKPMILTVKFDKILVEKKSVLVEKNHHSELNRINFNFF